LTQATENFEDLFENAPCGYLTLAPDGRIARVNGTLCDWTGYSRDDFAGKRVHQFLNMAGRIYFETHIAPLLRMRRSSVPVTGDCCRRAWW
jgi:sigma-B regulation protein RsbU (phosphoserine phosphatase)